MRIFQRTYEKESRFKLCVSFTEQNKKYDCFKPLCVSLKERNKKRYFKLYVSLKERKKKRKQVLNCAYLLQNETKRAVRTLLITTSSERRFFDACCGHFSACNAVAARVFLSEPYEPNKLFKMPLPHVSHDVQSNEICPAAK